MTWGISATTFAGYMAAAAATAATVSALASAQAQRKAASYNAKVAANNAQIAADQANVNEDAQRRRAAMAIGREAAGAAAGSGISGTNADNLEQSATYAELDALNIRYQGQLGVQSDMNQATLDNMQGKAANEAGYLNAGAAALSSYGTYQRGQAKTPGG